MRPPVEAPAGWRIIKVSADGGVVFGPPKEPTPKRRRKAAKRDFEADTRQYTDALTGDLALELATALGVSVTSLPQIGCGWSDSDQAWTFPERDGHGRVVGILQRYRSGKKRRAKGGKCGLSVPDNLADLPDPVLVVEGPTDVAACVTMGVAAVGRPSNMAGAALVAELLQSRDVIVVGENDRKDDGRHPGREGAIKIAEQLATIWQVAIRWVLPPEEHKDARAYLNAHSDDPVETGRSLVEYLNANAEIIEPQQVPVTFTIERMPDRVKANVTALRGDVVIAIDSFDPNSHAAREQFAAQVGEVAGVDSEVLTAELLKVVTEPVPEQVHRSSKPTKQTLLEDYDEEVAEELDRTDERVVREATVMLRDPRLVNLILEDIARCGVVGEKELGLTTYLIGVSRLLANPLAGIIQGSTSSGKSYIIERVAGMFPAEAILMATDLTPNALYYLPEGRLIHRWIVSGERSRKQDDDRAEATRALREMLASGKLRKAVPIKSGARMETVVIEQDGPIAFVESTTLAQIFEEDSNRALLLSTDESALQTRRVLDAVAKGAMGPKADVGEVIARHHALQRLLRRCRVVIPFADRLAEAMPHDRPEARRAIGHTLNLIRAVALLHQRQRVRGPIEHGDEIKAAIEDYVIARRLLVGPMGRLLDGGLPEAVVRFGTRLHDRYGGQSFTTREVIADDSTIKSRGRASEYLRALHDAGAVESVEEARGNKPAVWRFVDEVPTGGAVWLPTVDQLQETAPSVMVEHQVEWQPSTSPEGVTCTT